MKHFTVGETSQRARPRQCAGWGRALPMLGFLTAGLLLQYATAVVSSFLIHQQGIRTGDNLRVAWANWVLERFVHDPRGAHLPKIWPQGTSADVRPDLRVNPAWNPFDPSVWRDQPGFAVELSGVPVCLVHCFEGGGFLGETWVAFAPVKLRDPKNELPSSDDAPTVDTVIEWWQREWRAPKLRSIHDESVLHWWEYGPQSSSFGPSHQGYIFELTDEDLQNRAWVQHLLDTSTLRVTPPRWVELESLLDHAAATTSDPRRPLGLLSRAWGFPFRSVMERAELARLPLRFVQGGVDAWSARDWEVLSYDGVQIGLSDPFKHSASSVGVAIRPLWIGVVLNSVIYALALCCVSRALGALRSVPRMLRARRGECRACGHAHAGLARCPECGAVVK